MKRYTGRGLGGSQVQELLCLRTWGVSRSCCGCVHLEALRTPCYWDFMEASSHRREDLFTPFPAPRPSLEVVGWGWKAQASNHGAVLLVTSPIQEPTQLPPQNKRRSWCSYRLGICKGFKSSVPGTRGRDPYINFVLFRRHTLGLTISNKLKRCH